MGLFNKNSGKTGQHNATTLIAEGAIIIGDLILCGDIQIDGTLQGKVRTEGSISISPNGAVEGSIYANKAYINGRFRGEIIAQTIEVMEKGNVEADISAGEFTIKKGGLFMGNSKSVDNTQAPKQLTAAEPEQKPHAISLEGTLISEQEDNTSSKKTSAQRQKTAAVTDKKQAKVAKTS